MGHYPWFIVYNFLQAPQQQQRQQPARAPPYGTHRSPSSSGHAFLIWQARVPQKVGVMKMLRSAGIGFCASFCSDLVSNSVRTY